MDKLTLPSMLLTYLPHFLSPAKQDRKIGTFLVASGFSGFKRYVPRKSFHGHQSAITGRRIGKDS